LLPHLFPGSKVPLARLRDQENAMFTFADGRPRVTASPRRAGIDRRGMLADMRRAFAALRGGTSLTKRRCRPVWRRPIVPRPREGGAPAVMAAGRDGSAGRDDGGGGGASADGDGPPWPPSPAHEVARGAP